MIDFFVEVYHHIAKEGWHHQHVYPDTAEENCFNYTIGLYLEDLPELFLSGPVPPEVVNVLFDCVIERWRNSAIQLGLNYGILPNDMPLLIIPINPYSTVAADEYLCQLHEYRKWQQHEESRLLAVQIVYPDENGNWPTEEHYNHLITQVLLPTMEDTDWQELEN